jgi:hypothetical protein
MNMQMRTVMPVALTLTLFGISDASAQAVSCKQVIPPDFLFYFLYQDVNDTGPRSKTVDLVNGGEWVRLFNRQSGLYELAAKSHPDGRGGHRWGAPGWIDRRYLSPTERPC